MAQVHKALFIIADISGYTRFILNNPKTIQHAQVIIGELLQAILAEVDMPLEVYELQGDAVFFYAVKKDDEKEWQEARRVIGAKLERFFEVFEKRLWELRRSSVCVDCMACAHIDRLKIKMVVHAGEASFSQVGRFQHLAGPDIILVHRLLKNSVGKDEYILVTAPATKDIEISNAFNRSELTENLGDLGSLEVTVYVPKAALEAHTRPVPKMSRAAFIANFAKFYRRLLPIKYGFKRPAPFAHFRDDT